MFGFWSYRLQHHDDSTMVGTLYPAMVELSNSLPSKAKELTQKVTEATQKLKDIDFNFKPSTGRYEKDALEYFWILKNACEVDKAKVRLTALEAINKLISYKFLSAASEVDAVLFPPRNARQPPPTTNPDGTVTPAKPNPALVGKKRLLVDVLVEVLYNCAMFVDDAVQLVVLKNILTVIQSASSPIHDQSIVLSVRACFHIYISSMIPTNRNTAKATVIQVVTLTFKRLDASYSMVKTLSHQCGLSRDEILALEAQLEAENKNGSDGDHEQVKEDEREVKGDDESTQNDSKSNDSKSTQEKDETATNPEDDKTENDKTAEKSNENDSEPTKDNTKDATKNGESKDSVIRAISPKEIRLNQLRVGFDQMWSSLQHQQEQLVKLQADAYQILRSLGHQGMRPLSNDPQFADPPQPPQQRNFLLALELIYHILHEPGRILSSTLPFLSIIRDDIIPCIAFSLTSSIEDIFKLGASIFNALVIHFRSELKIELSYFFKFIVCDIIQHPNATFHHKVTILDMLVSLLRDRTFVIEMILNNDLALVPHYSQSSHPLSEIFRKKKRTRRADPPTDVVVDYTSNNNETSTTFMSMSSSSTSTTLNTTFNHSVIAPSTNDSTSERNSLSESRPSESFSLTTPTLSENVEQSEEKKNEQNDQNDQNVQNVEENKENNDETTSKPVEIAENVITPEDSPIETITSPSQSSTPLDVSVSLDPPMVSIESNNTTTTLLQPISPLPQLSMVPSTTSTTPLSPLMTPPLSPAPGSSAAPQGISPEEAELELNQLLLTPPDLITMPYPIMRDLLYSFQELLQTNHVAENWMTVRDDQEIKTLTTECINSIVRGLLSFQSDVQLGKYVSPYPREIADIVGNASDDVVYKHNKDSALYSHQNDLSHATSFSGGFKALQEYDTTLPGTITMPNAASRWDELDTYKFIFSKIFIPFELGELLILQHSYINLRSDSLPAITDISGNLIDEKFLVPKVLEARLQPLREYLLALQNPSITTKQLQRLNVDLAATEGYSVLRRLIQPLTEPEKIALVQLDGAIELNGQNDHQNDKKTIVNHNVINWLEAKDVYCELLMNKMQRFLWDCAIYAFNKVGVKQCFKILSHFALLDVNDPRVIANWLFYTPDLSKNEIGFFLGGHTRICTETLKFFMEHFNFTGLLFDQALREFLQTFRIPGEAQCIDRLTTAFGERFCACNPSVFRGNNAPSIFAFSIIMLNTDLHSNQIAKKMTKQEFIKNNSTIDDGYDLDLNMVTQVYDNICLNEIKMKDDEKKIASAAYSSRKRLQMFVKEGKDMAVYLSKQLRYTNKVINSGLERRFPESNAVKQANEGNEVNNEDISRQTLSLDEQLDNDINDSPSITNSSLNSGWYQPEFSLLLPSHTSKTDLVQFKTVKELVLNYSDFTTFDISRPLIEKRLISPPTVSRALAQRYFTNPSLCNYIRLEPKHAALVGAISHSLLPIIANCYHAIFNRNVLLSIQGQVSLQQTLAATTGMTVTPMAINTASTNDIVHGFQSKNVPNPTSPTSSQPSAQTTTTQTLSSVIQQDSKLIKLVVDGFRCSVRLAVVNNLKVYTDFLYLTWFSCATLIEYDPLRMLSFYNYTTFPRAITVDHNDPDCAFEIIEPIAVEKGRDAVVIEVIEDENREEEKEEKEEEKEEEFDLSVLEISDDEKSSQDPQGFVPLPDAEDPTDQPSLNLYSNVLKRCEVYSSTAYWTIDPPTDSSLTPAGTQPTQQQQQQAAKNAARFDASKHYLNAITGYTNIQFLQTRNVETFRQLLNSITKLECDYMSSQSWFTVLYMISYYNRIGLLHRSDDTPLPSPVSSNSGFSNPNAGLRFSENIDGSGVELVDNFVLDKFFNIAQLFSPTTAIMMLTQLKRTVLFELYPNRKLSELTGSTSSTLLENNANPGTFLQQSTTQAQQATTQSTKASVHKPGSLLSPTITTPSEYLAEMSLYIISCPQQYINSTQNTVLQVSSTILTHPQLNIPSLVNLLSSPTLYLTQKYVEVMFYLTNAHSGSDKDKDKDSKDQQVVLANQTPGIKKPIPTSIEQRTRFYQIILDVLRLGGCHSQSIINTFILTVAKQLCSQYLPITTPTTTLLTYYIFSPFEFIIHHHTVNYQAANGISNEILEFSLNCLEQIIKQQSTSIHTGWGIILRSLMYIAKSTNCPLGLITTAYNILNTILTDFFSLVTTSNLNGIYDMILALASFTNVNQYHLYIEEDDNSKVNTTNNRRQSTKQPQPRSSLSVKDTTALGSEIVIPATTLLSRTAVYLSKLTVLFNDMAKNPGLYIQAVQRYDKHILQERQSPVLVNDIRTLLMVSSQQQNSTDDNKDGDNNNNKDDKNRNRNNSTGNIPVATIQDEYYINWHSVLTLSPLLSNPQLHSSDQPITPLPTTLIHDKDELDVVLKKGDGAWKNLSNEDMEELSAKIAKRIQLSRRTLTICWTTLLKQLSVILVNHDVSVRSHSLSIFDKILLHYGLIWSKQEWSLFFDLIFIPIFNYVDCYHYNMFQLPLIDAIPVGDTLGFSQDQQQQQQQQTNAGRAFTQQQKQQQFFYQPTTTKPRQVITEQLNTTSPISPKLKKYVDKWIKTSLYAILLRLIHIYYFHHNILKPYLPHILTILFKLIHTTNLDIVRIAFRTWFTLCTYPTTTSLTVVISSSGNPASPNDSGEVTKTQVIISKEEWDQLFFWYLYISQHILPTALISDQTRSWLGLPAYQRYDPKIHPKKFVQMVIPGQQQQQANSDVIFNNNQNNTNSGQFFNPNLPSMCQTQYIYSQPVQSISSFVPFIDCVHDFNQKNAKNAKNGTRNLANTPNDSLFTIYSNFRDQNIPIPSDVPHIASLVGMLEGYNANQLNESIVNQQTDVVFNPTAAFHPSAHHIPQLPPEFVLGTDLNTILSSETQAQLSGQFKLTKSLDNNKSSSIKAINTANNTTPATPISRTQITSSPSSLSLTPSKRNTASRPRSTSVLQQQQQNKGNNGKYQIELMVYQQEMIILHSKVLLMMIDTVFNVFMTLYPPVYQNSPFQSNPTIATSQQQAGSSTPSPNPTLVAQSSSRQSLGLQLPQPDHSGGKNKNKNNSSKGNNDSNNLNSPLTNLTDSHFTTILDSLLLIIDFANEFNSDYTLRKALWATGFLYSENNIVDLTAIITRAMKISIRLIISRLCYKGDFNQELITNGTNNTVALPTLSPVQAHFKANLMFRLNMIINCTLSPYLYCTQLLPHLPTSTVSITNATAGLASMNVNTPPQLLQNQLQSNTPLQQQQQLLLQQQHNNHRLTNFTLQAAFPLLPKIMTTHDTTDKILSGGVTTVIDLDCCKVLDQVITEVFLGVFAHPELIVDVMKNFQPQVYQLIAVGTEPIRLLVSKMLQTMILSQAMTMGLQSSPYWSGNCNSDQNNVLNNIIINSDNNNDVDDDNGLELVVEDMKDGEY